jgi:hypothetical protein
LDNSSERALADEEVVVEEEEEDDDDDDDDEEEEVEVEEESEEEEEEVEEEEEEEEEEGSLPGHGKTGRRASSAARAPSGNRLYLTAAQARTLAEEEGLPFVRSTRKRTGKAATPYLCVNWHESHGRFDSHCAREETGESQWRRL